MARQFVRLTVEETWGEYDSGGDVLYIDLDTDNSFTMRPRPIKWKVRTFGVGNRLRKTGSAKTVLEGALNTLVYPSQIAVLMPLLTSSDGTAQLPSFTADHGWLLADGTTLAYRRYLGCRVRRANFTSGEADQLIRLSLDVAGKQPATITAEDLPTPDPEDYPADAPFVFEDASGAFTLGSSRVGFETFNLSIENLIDARFFESQYVQYLFYCGRNLTWDSRLAYKVTTDQAALEAVSALAAEITFSRAGYELKFEMHSRNYLETVEDDLSMDRLFLQNLALETAVDPGEGAETDFEIEVTTP